MLIPGEPTLFAIDAAITGLAWLALRRETPWFDVLFRAISAWIITAMAWGAPSLFAAIRALGWAGFVATPALFAVIAGHRRDLRFLAPTVALPAIAAWATLVEPTALEVNTHTLSVAGLEAPIRVVVLSDLQTDAVGDFERRVIDLTRELAPDLVLFPGDYLQLHDEQAYDAQALALRRLLQDDPLAPELGAWAVRGNMESRPDWPALFDGTWIAPIPTTRRIDLGPVVLTGLSFEDGFDPDFRVADEDRFHIVFAHGPDFALGDIQADLLIAGHTHGGQVNLPGWGPLLTFSAVPRAWAAGGGHEIAPGRHLIVSRGLGMERADAPRIRLNCRPEIVVIDLVPA